MGPAALATAPPRSRGAREAADSSRKAHDAPSAIPPASNTPYEQRAVEQVEQRLQDRTRNPGGEPGAQLPLGTTDLQTNSSLSRFYADAAAGELNLGERVRFVDAGTLGPGVLSSRADVGTSNGSSAMAGSAGVQDGGIILIDRRVLLDLGQLDAHVVGQVLGGGGDSVQTPANDEGFSRVAATHDQVLASFTFLGAAGDTVKHVGNSQAGPGSVAARLMPTASRVLGVAAHSAGPLAIAADPFYKAFTTFNDTEGTTKQRLGASALAGVKRIDNVGFGFSVGVVATGLLTVVAAPTALTIGLVGVSVALGASLLYTSSDTRSIDTKVDETIDGFVDSLTKK